MSTNNPLDIQDKVGGEKSGSPAHNQNSKSSSTAAINSPIDEGKQNIIEHKSQLVQFLEDGSKPPSSFRLGTEQEQFVYSTPDYCPADYDGRAPGIKAFLQTMTQFGWKPITELGLPIALRRGDCTITLEPGGQIELSGAPLFDVHQILEETRAYHEELRTVSQSLGLSFLALGYQPKHRRDLIPWMPKQRYKVMRDWMSRRGSRGLEMMQSTASLQITADFADETDMVQKLRVGLALQPVATALFANSPLADGKINGYLSYRSEIWSETDPDRCGSLPFVFEKGMGFERYADYALDVPMYFVIRDGKYVEVGGQSFREFLEGNLRALPDQRPVLIDWENHLSTVFPQVRLKQVLEMRGADAGDAISRVPALAALWAGILYDSDSLGAAWERVSRWTKVQRSDLEKGVAKQGFGTRIGRGSVKDLAQWMLDLSRQGLQRRNRRNNKDQDETRYLEPLQESVQAGLTFAEILLRRFEQDWNADINIALPAMCKETLS